MTNVRLLKNIFELNFGSAQKKIGSHQCSVLNESGTFDIRSFWYNQNTKFFFMPNGHYATDYYAFCPLCQMTDPI